MRTLESFLEKQVERTEVAEKLSDGFVIQQVELEGFMRYLEKTIIKFPEKFTVIVGRTGSGKTTLLDAITFALYRNSSRTDEGVKMSELCRVGGNVKVIFTQGSKIYKVTRGFASKSKSFLTLKIDGQEFPGSITEKEEKIKEILGLDYVGFRNSTFVRQEEMKALGARGAKRLEIFQKLFRLDMFEKAQEIVGERLKKIEKDISALEERIKAKKDYLRELPERTRSLTDKRKELEAAKKKLIELENILKKKEEEANLLITKHEEYLAAKTLASKLVNELKKIDSKLSKAKAQFQLVLPLKQEISKLEAELKDFEDLRKEYEKLNELRQKVESLRNEKKIYESQGRVLTREHENELQRLSARLQAQENRIEALKTDIDKDKAFALLRSEGSLNERISRIDKEVVWLKDKIELVNKLKEEQVIAKEELGEVSKNVARIDESSFILSELKEGIKTLKSDLEKEEKDYKIKLSELSNRITTLEKSISATGFDKEAEKKLLELKNLISDSEKKSKLLKSKREEVEAIGDRSKLIEELGEQKAQDERSIESLSKKLEKLAKLEERHQNINKELDKLRVLEKDSSKYCSALDKEVALLSERLKELEKVGEEIKQAELEEKNLREKAELYSLLKDRIFHRKGITMYAIDQLLPTLSLETSKNLSDLTDNRFQNVKLVPYEERGEYGIKIDVLGVDNIWHDVNEFSGGEKTQINAALRFALAKELAALPQVGKTYGRMKTLFIDEGDLGSLDTEISRELFVRKLFDLGRFFDKVILITHLSEVAERFPAKIQIVMEGGRSKVSS